LSLNKNILTTFLTQIPVIILSFITGVFIARTIGVDGKGILSIFLANIQLIALFTGFSINSGIVYFISSKKIDYNKVLGICVYIFLLSLLLGGIVVFIPGKIESLLFPDNYSSIYYKLYLYLSFIITLINTIFIGILQSKKRYSLINSIAIVNSLFGVIVFTVIYFTNYIDLFEDKMDNVLFYTLIIISVNTLLYTFMYIRKDRVVPNLKLSIKTELKPFFKYIGVVYISQVINFFNYRLDIWFVNSYNGVEQLGLYSLAVNLSQMLLVVSNPIANVLFPYLTSETNKEKNINILSFFSRINISFLLLIGAFFYFIGAFFIPIIYGVGFGGSVEAFKIMIIATFFLGASKVFSTYLASVNQINYNLLATIIAFIVTIVLNIILIPVYGIIGASITSLLAYFSIFVVVFLRTTYLNNSIFVNWFIIKKNDFKQINMLK